MGIADEVIDDKNLFEDFTILRWVKWTGRKPDFNGSVYIRWNGKFTSNGIVHDGVLTKLDGDKTQYCIENGKLIPDYTDEQRAIMEDMYWLEEINDLEAFSKYRDA